MRGGIGPLGIGPQARNLGRGARSREGIQSPREGQVASGSSAGSRWEHPEYWEGWGGMRDWERAWGPGEPHGIRRKSTGPWEETRILGRTRGRGAGASEG